MSAALALTAAAGLAAYLALATPRLRVLVIALGAVAVVALALALAGRSRLLGAALASLAGAVVVLDLLRGRSPVLLVTGAAILLVLGELASLSLSMRSVELVTRELLARRAAYLGAIAIAGLAVAAAVELASRAAVRGGLEAAVVAVAATVLVLALASALAVGRRGEHPPSD